MTSHPHVSRLVPPGPTVRAVHTATEAAPAKPDGATPDGATLVRAVAGDARELGRLLADIEPLRADASATIVTDADAEAVRFLAVLAVLEGRAPMPEYDLEDPSLKWHAPKGVEAVPNPPTIVTRPGGSA
jgi:hypothetical protein